jgi:hypothetical protein
VEHLHWVGRLCEGVINPRARVSEAMADRAMSKMVLGRGRGGLKRWREVKKRWENATWR